MKYPVFIVGSPRSGTSILTRGLLDVGYAGYNEGNYLSLLRGAEKLVDGHFRVHGRSHPRALTSTIDADAVKAAMYRAIVDQIGDTYAGRPWVDKTGTEDMIEAIPILLRFWPESRFVFARRRGIENVVSRMRKFPEHPFQHHCTSWARMMSGWRSLRERLPTLAAVEIDQREIAETPAIAAERLAGLLGLSAEAATAMTGVFTRDRPQESEQGSAMRVLSLHTAGWSDQEQEIFRLRCTEQMRLNNYAFDTRYWRDPPAQARATA